MKVDLVLALLCFDALFVFSAPAQTPVSVTIDPHAAAGQRIPDYFVGLSFGMRALLPSTSGEHFFSPTNKPLVMLFQNIGIRHLRVGGTTVEAPPKTPIPGTREIDDLFAFTRAAGVQHIIYSLRLLETNHALHYADVDAGIAKYIWNHYQPLLDSFSIGNEPNLQRVFHQDADIRDFDTYLAKWQQFAAAITNAVPGARFAGPDAASGNISWTTNFARAERDSGIISSITEHYYVGGAGRDVPPEKGIDDMLSAAWLEHCQKLYDDMAVPVMSYGLPFRFTEANDHYSGGVRDASDTAAGALWALDFLHWWAAHDAKGVDFHNTQWVVSDIITLDDNHEPSINPKAYGLKAFDLGSHGNVEPIVVSNSAGINFTAYAVRTENSHLVTLINKEHGAKASEAEVTITLPGSSDHAEVIFLTVPKGDAATKTGVTLGGVSIDGHGVWQGKWVPLSTRKAGLFTLTLPPVSAAIVIISGKSR